MNILHLSHVLNINTIFFSISALNTIPEEFVNNVYISKNSLENQIRCILNDYPIVENDTIKPWLLQVISVIDLTTLSGDDTRSNVIRLCQKVSTIKLFGPRF